MKMDRMFRRIMDEMESVKGKLSEEYIFNGEEEGMAPEGQEQGMPVQEPDMQVQGDEEPVEGGAQTIMKADPVIMKMRKIAMEGLEKYGDNPLDPIYTFLKKVFLEADKVITDSEK